MESLEHLLGSVQRCTACNLMRENEDSGIAYVPILAKPEAKVVFIGRDPSPRTAHIVGVRGGKSAFINEVFMIVDNAGVSDSHAYITDLCKCHWRTSVGKPLSGTESRSSKLDPSVAEVCMNQWLLQELAILQPSLVVTFGEEVYQLVRPLISRPSSPPPRLSAKKDKSVEDAESWFVTNGPLLLRHPAVSFPLAPLRHPGNSGRLPKKPERGDKRYSYHRKATKAVTELVKTACA